METRVKNASPGSDRSYNYLLQSTDLLETAITVEVALNKVVSRINFLFLVYRLGLESLLLLLRCYSSI